MSTALPGEAPSWNVDVELHLNGISDTQDIPARFADHLAGQEGFTFGSLTSRAIRVFEQDGTVMNFDLQIQATEESAARNAAQDISARALGAVCKGSPTTGSFGWTMTLRVAPQGP
jgi:hypothetical protein